MLLTLIDVNEVINNVKVMPELTSALWDGGQYSKILTDYHMVYYPTYLYLPQFMLFLFA